MDEEPECYKCQDWRRMGLSDRCPYHDRLFWQSVDQAFKESVTVVHNGELADEELLKGNQNDRG